MRLILVTFILFSVWPESRIANATDAVTAAPAPDAGQPPSNTYKAIDLRAKMARMKLKEGRNTVYADKQGKKLQAEVKNGEIVGYVSVDSAGKVVTIKSQSTNSGVPTAGQQALVHKCFVVTQECLNNPLPRSGNPEDCFLEVACPARGSLSSMFTR